MKLLTHLCIFDLFLDLRSFQSPYFCVEKVIGGKGACMWGMFLPLLAFRWEGGGRGGANERYTKLRAIILYFFYILIVPF